MQIERIVNNVTTLGPGRRLCVWVNGCNRRCQGCVSPELREFAPQNECDIDDVFSAYDYSRIDGVTVSGGEPFEQAEELNRLADFLAARGVKDILVYTGYTVSQLRGKSAATDEALGKIAVLIDGPYIEQLDDGKGNLKGSANQSVIFLKPQFRRRYEQYRREKREVQIVPLVCGELAVGIPDKEIIDNFKNRRV